MTEIDTIITVGLNPAIDRVLEAPNFKVGGHQAVRQLDRYPAGKAINVSRALAVLGERNIATGFVGDEQIEAFERFLLHQSGPRIVCQFLTVKGRTRENITIVDPVAKVDTHLRDAGFEVDEHDIHRMRSKVGLLARPNTVICFCGALPPGLSADEFAVMLRYCIEAGAKVAVDTSGEALAAACELPLWLVKPNAEELAAVAGTSASPSDLFAAATELAKRVEMVMVTMGADGARLIGPDVAIGARVDSGDLDVMNTVGCGDCLLAGFVSGMARGKTIEQSLQRAVATATANAMALATADFDMAKVGELSSHVRVEPWNVG